MGDDQTSEKIAQALFRELPATGGGDKSIFDARQLVIALLLEENEALTVSEIAEKLGGVSVGTIIPWIEEGEAKGRFERYKQRRVDNRQTWVRLTPRGKRERLRTRGKKGGPDVQRGAGSGDRSEPHEEE
jgi:DNA-binding MarR family transcriptional regulator